VLLEVGSGVIWDDLVAYAVSNGWGGAENLSLIPGETGAAAVQNIGAYGAEICDIVEGVHSMEITSGSKKYFTTSECKYGYRESVFKNELKGKYIITSVLLRLQKKPLFKLDYSHLKEEVLRSGDITLENIRKTIIEIRSSKLPDPAILGNAGSFFMNPVIPISLFEEMKSKFPSVPSYPIDEHTKKVPAGWLIEQSGWKGKSLGNAGVHKNQALVLVNLGGATGEEIKNLSDVIRQDVFQQFGVELTPEVNFIF
jgi:UDP-N-acetylmuramate dehydrogenase